MTQNKLLTREIIRHIFTNFGCIQDPNNDNLLLTERFATNKSVTIKYEDEAEIAHPVFAGQLTLGSNLFKVLVIDLTVDKEAPEYCCVFRLDTLPLHGLRLCYDEQDTGLFKLYNDVNKTWMDAPIDIQAMILGGVEKVVSYGLLWDPCSQFEDLFQLALKLTEL